MEKTLRERIEEKIKKNKKEHKIAKIVFLMGFTLLFGYLFWNISCLYIKYSLATIFIPESVDMLMWISLIPSLSFAFLLTLIMLLLTFGSKWYYYDEFELTGNVTFNGKTVTKKEFKILAVLPIYEIKELDAENYEIKASSYSMTGVRGLETFVVEKWKVRIDSIWTI